MELALRRIHDEIERWYWRYEGKLRGAVGNVEYIPHYLYLVLFNG